MKLTVDLENASVIGDWPIRAETCTIIATFNHENFIDTCIENALNQSVSDNHILIHDDLSSDSTLEKLINWQKLYPKKITVISQKVNQYSQGIPIYPRLISLVQSEFCALCEGDDYWTDDTKLEKQIELLRSNADIGLVFHDVEIIANRKDSEYKDALTTLLSRATEKEYFTHEDIASGNFIMTCSVVLRKESLRDEYLNSIHNLVLEDVILFSQISENYKLKFISEKMAVYRMHENSSWSNASEKHRLNSAMATRWFLASRIQFPQNLLFQKNLINNLWNSPNLPLELNPIGDYISLLENKEKTIAVLQLELERLTNSTSWKITKIFRYIKKFFRSS